jgi:hypothetical protein
MRTPGKTVKMFPWDEIRKEERLKREGCSAMRVRDGKHLPCFLYRKLLAVFKVGSTH